MPVSNEDTAQLFENLGMLLELKGDSVFKIRAYQRAARTISHLSFSLAQAVEDGTDLKQIPGIGKVISDKIHELIQTGRVSTYERLLAELPQGAQTLMDVPGIGPKTALLISKELGISTIDEVEHAIQEGQMAALPQMGQEAAENILRRIQSSRTNDQRTPKPDRAKVSQAAQAGAC